MQDYMEDTLSDQILLSSNLKKGNNYIKGIILKQYVETYYKNNSLDYLDVLDWCQNTGQRHEKIISQFLFLGIMWVFE